MNLKLRKTSKQIGGSVSNIEEAIIATENDPRYYEGGTDTTLSLKPGKWQTRSALILSAFRALAFVAGILQLYIRSTDHISDVSPHILLVTAGGYILLTALFFVRWSSVSIWLYIMLGCDIILSIFLLLTTGGSRSPFLFLALSPVLTAAIYLDFKVSAIIALMSTAYAIILFLNPFADTAIIGTDISFLIIYLMTVGLIAVLPYIINVNVRQRLRYQNILLERSRLSREIHDGTVQTVTALRWQVQLLQRRLAEKGIELDDVNELERLTGKAQRDARESLELLRNFTGDGSFLPHLRDYIGYLQQEAKINFEIGSKANDLHLAPIVELELLRICQEALTNVRQHSGAKNVKVSVEIASGKVRVVIDDDGIGFDVVPYYHKSAHYQGHGLRVMEERAKSVGGKLIILSVPGRGTQINVELPVSIIGNSLLWNIV